MHKHIISKVILITSDFITLFCSLILTYLIFLLNSIDIGSYVPFELKDNYTAIHFIISLLCSIWFWIRLRHYTYRKPFWFELKEILRTLFIFFIIELAIIGLSKLYISRTFWVVTWGCIFILVPFTRASLKNFLIWKGIYTKDTVIIGNGENAQNVFKALSEEKYLGFNIRLFVSTEDVSINTIGDVPVMRHNPELLLKIVDPEFTQFIIAIDEATKSKQDFWLRYLIKKGCRAVSVIPDFRGIPLYGTDMTFLFSHEMMLFRVNNNLAKRASKLLKRTFDIMGSIFLMIILSPVFLFLYFFLFLFHLFPYY